MKVRAVAACTTFVAAGIAAATALGVGNPTGQWATPKSIHAVMLSRPLEVLVCYSDACNVNFDGSVSSDWQPTKVHVIKATVSGLGRSKLIRGTRRYQLFDVSVCAVDYLQGGARISAEFRWYTKRPPSTTKPVTDPSTGYTSTMTDGGGAYAADWNQPDVEPIAQNGC